MATNASSVARSLKLNNIPTSVNTWMGDRQGRPSTVNLCPFVGVDLKSMTDRLYSRRRVDTDVK